MDLPFVSAICVTGKSAWHVERLLPGAIRSFSEQDYPADRRELVIVTDRDVSLPPDPHLRVVQTAPGRTLGELRNLGLDAARGEYCLQFDDDDHHHPGRMLAQMRACLQRPGTPSFLQRQLCYDWTTDTAFTRDLGHTFIHGTICHPSSEARYPALALEEDTAFLDPWPGHIVINNDPMLYVRFFHGHNSWDRAHVLRAHASDWARAQWHLSDRHRVHLRSVLDRYPGVREGSKAG